MRPPPGTDSSTQIGSRFAAVLAVVIAPFSIGVWFVFSDRDELGSWFFVSPLFVCLFFVLDAFFLSFFHV